MAKNDRKKEDSRAALQDFVTVAFAEDMDLAKQYKKMLTESEIPVAIKAQRNTPTFNSFAVMVPEDFLDEAHVLIESQSSHDSFYDLASADDSITHWDDDAYDNF